MWRGWEAIDGQRGNKESGRRPVLAAGRRDVMCFDSQGGIVSPISGLRLCPAVLWCCATRLFWIFGNILWRTYCNAWDTGFHRLYTSRDHTIIFTFWYKARHTLIQHFPSLYCTVHNEVQPLLRHLVQLLSNNHVPPLLLSVHLRPRRRPTFLLFCTS